jgi:oligoribonuclease NrnB/cAMP/cGMP phosphodiesterase (DHH superfamily)
MHTTTTTIIYHSRDLDGWTSAAILQHYLGGKTNLSLIGYDYGQPFSVKSLPEGEPVIMIDVSMPMDIMREISERSSNRFMWIDHHISAINEYKQHKPFLNAMLDTSIAACELAWKYCYLDKQLPFAVLLLGQYDTWRNSDYEKWNELILPFQFGMRMHCNSPETFDTTLLEDSDDSTLLIRDVIREGKIVLKYQDQVNEHSCKRAFEIEFEGLRAICINAGGIGSDAFKSVYNEAKHDIMLTFAYGGGFWTVSLYTTKKDTVNCSVLAKKYGGGGHVAAAGFQLASIDSIINAIKK